MRDGLDPAQRVRRGRAATAENLGAAQVELTPEDLREIDAATAKVTVHGGRYSASAQKMIDR